jgi:hypothetical protein
MPAVTAQAVQDYYERHQSDFGGAKFETVAEAIRLRLITQQREKWLNRFISELRRHADIKVLVEFSTAAQSGE